MLSLQAKITSKGQITIPKQIRESLSIRTGDRLEFSLEDSNRIALRKKGGVGSSAGCAKSRLKHGCKPLTDQEIDEAIRGHMKRKYSRASRGK